MANNSGFDNNSVGLMGGAFVGIGAANLAGLVGVAQAEYGEGVALVGLGSGLAFVGTGLAFLVAYLINKKSESAVKA